MGLKEMLFKDFGKDLPIDGGFGQSAVDPIRITTKSPTEAAMAQLQVARCIYGINGWYWRTIGITLVESSQGRVEKFSSEVKYIENDQIVTEKRNFYFDISGVELATDQQLPTTRVQIGYPAELDLPWQLGWFHFDGLIDNEPIHPGLGVTVAYSAPQAKMTVYAYDRGIGDAIMADPNGSAKAEHLQAISDFELMNPHAETIRDHEEAGVHLKMYENGNALSAVLVAPFRNFFFKLRITHESCTEPFMFDCVWSTISTFATMVERKNGKG